MPDDSQGATEHGMMQSKLSWYDCSRDITPHPILTPYPSLSPFIHQPSFLHSRGERITMSSQEAAKAPSNHQKQRQVGAFRSDKTSLGSGQAKGTKMPTVTSSCT